jgi:hypothetical protein
VEYVSGAVAEAEDAGEAEPEPEKPAKAAKATKTASKTAAKATEKVADAGSNEGSAEDAKPAKTTKAAKAPAKAAAKTADKAPAKAPAKAAAKTSENAPAKATAKDTPKAAEKAAVKKRDAEQENVEDDLPELDNEDQSVLSLLDEGDLTATAQRLESTAAATEFRLGGLLYHIKKSGVYKDLDPSYAEPGGFQKYLTEFYNTDYRKAMYLIQIYVSFTLAGVENPAERVAEIGWSKAAKIANLMVQEDADVDGLLELAGNNTVRDLSEAIKDHVSVGGEKGESGEKKVRLTLKYRFYEEQAREIETFIAAAKEQLGTDDDSEALHHIITEWGIQNLGSASASTEDVEEEAPAKGRSKRSA